MNTILTDDERPKLPMPRIVRGTNPHCYSGRDMEAYADDREAAVLAKLAQQEPVAEIEVSAAPAGGVTATVWSVHLAPGTYSLHLHPAPPKEQPERFLRPFEKPEDAAMSKTERELAAMNRYIEKITKDKNSSVGFLTKAGIIDANGELAEHYRSLQSADAKPQEPVCVECDGTGRVSGSQSHFDCPECTLPAPQQADRQRVPQWHEAVQKVAAENDLEPEFIELVFNELMPVFMADKDAAGYVTIPLDSLIECDSYGVHGSDFYRCKVCGAESGAGVLNKGISHASDCPLAAAPEAPAQASAVDERAAFEAWASEQFYSGLAQVSDTWSNERGLYTDASHHMAWHAWQARAALAQKGGAA